MKDRRGETRREPAICLTSNARDANTAVAAAGFENGFADGDGFDRFGWRRETGRFAFDAVEEMTGLRDVHIAFFEVDELLFADGTEHRMSADVFSDGLPI